MLTYEVRWTDVARTKSFVKLAPTFTSGLSYSQISQISQIETGKRKGSTDILSALAKALKVTLEEVIAREAE